MRSARRGADQRYLEQLRGDRLEITGDDLRAAGIPESPAIGRALGETLRRKLDGEIGGRDAELALALESPRADRRVSFAIALPGARVLFSTREGGVSEGPYESLNRAC